MNDNQLFAILFPIISAGLTARGITVPPGNILQGYQPTQQGAPEGRFVYLYKIGNMPVGHVRRDSVWDADAGIMRETELQTWLATYQVNAMAKQDPTDEDSLTASDIVRAVRGVLQSSDTITLLRAQLVAILRIDALRNPPFTDDSNRYEYVPSFDFVLTFDELYVGASPVVQTVEYNVNRV